MYDLLLQPTVGYLKLLARDLPQEIQVYLLRQILPLVETYARKSPEDEALLRGARAFLRSLEEHSPSPLDPKVHSTLPDKEPLKVGKSGDPGRTYSGTLRILGISRRQAVRLALAAGASHIHFQDPIPVAWLRREDDTQVSEVPGLPHELIDRERLKKQAESEE